MHYFQLDCKLQQADHLPQEIWGKPYSGEVITGGGDLVGQFSAQNQTVITPGIYFLFYFGRE